MALVLLVPTMALAGVSFLPPDKTWLDFAVLATSGVIGIAIADSLFFASLNRLGAARHAVVDCLYSPFVVLCAVVGLGEPLSLVLVVALLLMVTAVLLGTRGPVPDFAEGAGPAGVGIAGGSGAAVPGALGAGAAVPGALGAGALGAGASRPHVPSPLLRRELRLGVVYGALSLLLMAIGITMAKPVLNRSDVLWATTVRISGAVLFLGVQGLLPAHRAVTRRIFTPSREWRILVPAGFIGTYIAMLLWIAGMKYTNASVSSVINQTSTILVPLLAWLILRERLTSRIILAVFLGFAGASLLGLLPPHLHRSVRSGVEAASQVASEVVRQVPSKR